MNILSDAMEDRKKKAINLTIVIPAEALSGNGDAVIESPKEDVENDEKEEDEAEKVDQPPGLDAEKEEFIAKDKQDLLRKKKLGISPKTLDEKAGMGILEG